MLEQRLNVDAGSFFEKIRSIDYLLIIIILILGIISSFAMYSTDGGKFLYHTKSHILRFGIFFVLFLVLSFVQTKVWHHIGYIFYFVIYLCSFGFYILVLLPLVHSVGLAYMFLIYSHLN